LFFALFLYSLDDLSDDSSAVAFFLHRRDTFPHKDHLSKKRFCLVPPGWDLERYSRHSCDDRSHQHLSKAQVYELDSHGSIEWLKRPVDRRDKGIVRISRLYMARGLSSKFGAVLAVAIALKHGWARAMLLDIRRRPDTSCDL
jgi:hypothetical protein